MSTPQTTDTITMFESIMDLAVAKATEKGTTVTLIVAPVLVVFEFIQALRVQNGQEPLPAGTPTAARLAER